MPLRVRSRFGKYRIVSRLGDGGFSTVYSAFDTVQGVQVALKVPYNGSPDDFAIQRLRNEIRLAERLRHPNILPIRNADVVEGHLIAAYPLGEESLASRLQRRIAVTRALDFFEQMLEALAYAHGLRVMHLDVKPDNVILFPSGIARLCDFGLAKSCDHTAVASGSGTIGYIAPEQAMGRPSFRSDVFSAALVLYRMLAGDVPEWPYKWPLPGHARLRRKISPALMDLLRRSLLVDHRKRPANAGAMLRAYRGIRVKTRA